MAGGGHGAGKAWRYLRLYGPTRTWAKVRARSDGGGEALVERAAEPGRFVAMVGCGAFAFATLAHFLPRGSVRACVDPDARAATRLGRAYGAAYVAADIARVLADPGVRLVMVAARHSAHAALAVRAMAAGKAVHLEKPPAVDADGVEALAGAVARGGVLTLGYNRPWAPLWRRATAALAGEHGPVAASLFVVGHAIGPEHWYRGPGEGGRVLGNVCHWLDLARALVDPAGRYPITVTPGPTSGDDVALLLGFGDGSAVSVLFSVKAEPFEGVRERIVAHRGDVLVELEDFARLRVTRGRRARAWRPLWRDHGHRACVAASVAAARAGAGLGSGEVWERAMLPLVAARAVATGTAQVATAWPG